EKLVILGAGESGVGAAVLAKQQGYDVFITDSQIIKEKHKKVLLQHQIDWEEAKHSEERILKADLVVKSPGISDEIPLVKKIEEKGISIISEIEFASRFTDAKIIAVTGSNGKTTVVNWL